MTTPKNSRAICAGAVFVSVACVGATAHAQIGTAVIEQHKAGLEKQITDPDQQREGGTQPRDCDGAPGAVGAGPRHRRLQCR